MRHAEIATSPLQRHRDAAQAERLAPLRDVQYPAIVHPSANLADFYREMGDLIAVELVPTTAGATSRRCVNAGSPA